jgi:hypothetical protein
MFYMWEDQLRPLLIVYVAPRYLVASIVPSSLLWSVHGKISWFLFRVILNNSHLSGLNSWTSTFPIIQGHWYHFGGFGHQMRIWLWARLWCHLQTVGFAFNGVLQVINIGKKLTRTKERPLRDNERTYNVSEVQPPTTSFCERLCRKEWPYLPCCHGVDAQRW